MKSSENHNDLIIRWMDGTLSDDQLETLKASEDFQDFKDIIDEVDEWKLSPLDVEGSFTNLQSKLPRAKTINWYQTTVFRVAASLIPIVALWYIFFFNTNQKFSTGLAQTKEFFLPDSSLIVLRPLSSVTFDPNNWKENRSVKLDGRGYFDVKKGSPFTIAFGEGLVEVLGTTFEIANERSLTEVICYSGKVRATLGNQQFELTAGQGVKSTYQSTPERLELHNTRWSKNKVQFRKVPLSIVLQSLEKHFNLEIDASQVNASQTYTGAFNTENVDAALEMVLGSMDINYDKQEENIILQ